MVYAKMMFNDLAGQLAADVICIAVGAIARELAPHLLQGTNIKLLNENIHIPHPSKSNNGWMTTPERDCDVKVACKIADTICGGERMPSSGHFKYYLQNYMCG